MNQKKQSQMNVVKATLFYATIYTLATTTFLGCSSDGNEEGSLDQVVTTDFRLQRANSCSDVRDFLLNRYTDQIVERMHDRFLYEYKHKGKNDYFSAVAGAEDSKNMNEGAPTHNGSEVGVPNSSGNGKVKGSSTVDYTKTNNHDVNADEADVVKTIGEYTFILNSKKFIVAKTWKPNEVSIVKTIEISDFSRTYDQIFNDISLLKSKSFKENYKGKESKYKYGEEEYVSEIKGDDKGDRIVAKSLAIEGHTLYIFLSFSPKDYYLEEEVKDDVLKDIQKGIRVVSLDISDPSLVSIKSIIDLETNNVDARTVRAGTYAVSEAVFGDKIMNHLEDSVSRSDVKSLFSLMATDKYATGSAEEQLSIQAKTRYRVYNFLAKRLKSEDIESHLPKQILRETNLSPTKSSRMVECSDIYSVGGDPRSSLLVVTPLPKDKQLPTKNVGLLASFDHVYSTKDSLYLAQKLYAYYSWWGGGTSTAIHKFNYSEELGGAHYAASGKVDGILNDQFSMNEYDGHLRLVTTITPTFRGVEEGIEEFDMEMPRRNESKNNLYILKQNGDSFDRTGSIENLAPGERVYSARFIGDKGYVVTYRQIDPLFTFDLSNPEQPKKLGELKIPGYSSYIHPLDDTHLLTIGREGNEFGAVGGTLLQIFDVSDMKDPKRVSKLELNKDSYGYSLAESNSHAFTFDSSSGILSIPYVGNVYSDGVAASRGRRGDRSDYKYFKGFFFFSISVENGIESIGKINHVDQVTCVGNSNKNNCEEGEGSEESQYYADTLMRSIIMKGDPKTAFGEGANEVSTYIYTISNIGLMVQPLSEPTDITSVRF